MFDMDRFKSAKTCVDDFSNGFETLPTGVCKPCPQLPTAPQLQIRDTEPEMILIRSPNVWRPFCKGLGALALCILFISGLRAEIVIGVAVPLSGRFADFGKDIQLGVNLAVAQANARGGIGGESLRVVVEDDKCNEAGGRDAANRLIGANVDAVIGHVCWRASIAGSALYHANEIIQISPATRYGKYTEERPDPTGGTYRLVGRSDQQVPFLAKLIRERYRGLRIAIVHDNSPYGKGLATALQAELAADKIRDVLFVDYEPGKNQYRALVSKVNDAVAEVLFVGGYFGDAAVIVRDMRARGMTVPMVGADALGSSEFRTIAGPAGDGTIFSAEADPRKLNSARDLMALISARNTVPQPYSIYAFAAVETLVQAIDAAGPGEYRALSDMLNTSAFTTVLGTVRFDKTGDAVVPAYAGYEWAGGSIRPLGD